MGERAKNIFKRMSYPQLIGLSIVVIILVGTLLLRLPAASRDGVPPAFADCLFTATSATCVTGLVVFDTYTQWTLFGQTVILCMIQVGGLGFMAVVMLFSLAFRRRVGLKTRTLLQESVNSLKIGGIVNLFKKLLIGTFLFEGIGAVILSAKLVPKLGLWQGIYTGAFLSVSSFCNAGFDLLGRFGEFSSLTSVNGDAVFILTISALVIIGGIGFFVWEDIITKKQQWSKYLLHTKIVLSVSGILLVSGTVLFFVFESNASLAGMSFPKKLLNAFFCAVTPRTAGFNSVELGDMSGAGTLLTDILMFVGGSPGSTAGGVKTATIAIFFIALVSNLSKSEDENIFGRRLEDTALRTAAAVVTIYITILLAGTLAVSALTPQATIGQIITETFSALGTVGLSSGVTAMANTPARMVLALMMYCGRVGSLTFMLIFRDRETTHGSARCPQERISIG